VIYDTPLAGARVRQPIRVTHSGEEGLMQWSQLRSVFFTCFEEGAHRKTGVSDRSMVRARGGGGTHPAVGTEWILRSFHNVN
jgi:hypothetical protein